MLNKWLTPAPKYLLAALMSACLLSGQALAQQSYPDVPADHWAQQALEQLSETYGLKLGYPDGSFKGERTLTRYEMAALVLRLLEKMPAQAQTGPEIERLKSYLAAELEKLAAASEEERQMIYDQIELLDVQSMERDQQLLNQLQLQLPFRLSGDLALRYEHRTSDWSTASSTLSSTPQSRVTLSLDSLPMELPFAYGARLSVGNQRNPANPWWRLGDYFARVDFALDRFFVSWRPADFLDITAGKFKNLYANSELLMDFDIQPEGAFQRLQFKDIAPFWPSASLTLGETIINMNQVFNGSTFVLHAKGDSRLAFGDSVHLDLSAGYHHYLNEAALFSANQVASENNLEARLVGNQQRNTANTEFGILNGFAGLTWQITPDLPLTLSGDYLYNLRASSLNQGLQAGLSLGQTRLPGQWQLAYFFKYLEKDASVSLFVEDQLGGTDVMAHEVQASLKVWDQTTLFATYQLADRLAGPNSLTEAPVHTLRAGIFQAF